MCDEISCLNILHVTNYVFIFEKKNNCETVIETSKLYLSNRLIARRKALVISIDIVTVLVVIYLIIY